MIEGRPSVEIGPTRVTAREVWREFSTFQVKAQAGFETHEDRLEAYLKVMGTASDYFSDPDTARRYNRETRGLFTNLVYEHENHAAIPMDFFLEAKTRLNEEVLDRGFSRRLAHKYPEEVDLMRVMLGKEVVNTGLALKDERKAVAHLERLASKAEKSPAVTEQVTPTNDKQVKIKAAAIEVLSKDPDLAQDLSKRDGLIQALSQVAEGGASPDLITDRLTPFRDGIDILESDSIFEDLRYNASLGNTDYVKGRIGEVLAGVRNPDYVFSYWAEKGAIPKELLNSFDEVTTLAELSEISRVVAVETREVRALYLTPFLQKGISASLLREIVEGNFELSDGLIKEQVETFLDFYDQAKLELEKPDLSKTEKQKWSTKKKILTGILIAAVAASPFIYKNFMSSPDSQPGDQTTIEELIKGISDDDLAQLEESSDPEIKIGIDGPASEESSPFGVPSPGGAPGPESSKPPPYPISTSEITPKNDSPESIKEAQKIVLWNLEGNDLFGLYRTMSSTVFNANTKGWIVNRQFQPESQPVFADSSGIRLTSPEFTTSNRIIELPSRENYAPTKDSVRVIGAGSGYSVLQTTDGSYFINLSPNDVGKIVSISYSLGKTEKRIIPNPTAQEKAEAARKVITVDDLPDGNLKKFMLELKANTTHNPAVKAKILELYIRKNFIYSLDGKWSNIYKGEPDAKGFFRKVAELQRCDCDVANSALVMLLRSIDIPARMVYGIAHTGNFLNPDEKKMTGSEGHGWSEAYAGGKWMPLDGTPENMDNFTKRSLEGQMNQRDIDNEREKDRLMVELEMAKKTIEETPLLSTLLQLTLANSLFYGVNILLRRSNNKRTEKSLKELEERSQTYLRSYPELVPNLYSQASRRLGVYRIYEGVSKLQLIPPFSLMSFLLKDGPRARIFDQLPFGKNLDQNVSPSPEPNTLEFMTKVLGFKDKEAKRRLLTTEYRQSRNQVSYDMQQLAISVTNSDPLLDNYELAGFIRNRVSKMSTPGSSEDWERNKKRMADTIFARYQRIRSREERGIIKVSRLDGVDPIFPPKMSREDFDDQMGDIFRLRLVDIAVREDFLVNVQKLGVGLVDSIKAVRA